MEAPETISEDGRDLDPSWTRWTMGFLALALVLRLVRALQNYPMWCDETMLAANLLDRSWTELAGPLDYRQVCSLGFLTLELLAVRILGFSELSLRLFPLLCALASVPVFYLFAREILGRGTAGALLAVANFSVSEPLIRYASETKPYAADLLASLVLLWLTVSWLRCPRAARQLWLLAAAAPVAVVVSLPSVFTIGAIVLVGCCALLRRRETSIVCAFAGFVTTAGLAVAAMASVGQYRTSPSDRAYFLKFWADAFPPSGRDPVALVRWLFRVNTGPLFAFPHGADARLAWLTPVVFGCFALGALLFLRKHKSIGAVLVLPILITLAASALRRYPYGVSARVNLYLVPSILLLAAAGTSWLCSRAAPYLATRKSIIGLGCLFTLFAAYKLGNDLGHPYRAPWDRTAHEFARWFWDEMSVDGEVVCVRSDLGIPFRTKRWAYDGADQYLCYQRIYSRRHRQGQAPDWSRISAERPLRCVLLSRLPEQVPLFRKWIEEHGDRYTLKEVRSYPAARGALVEPAMFYVVCEFVPSEAAIAAGESPKLR